jgi:hypothetical protein
MAIERCPWLYFLIAALFFILPVLFLQAQDAGYFPDSGGGEIRFIQRLTWTGDEYARRYEVVIEKEEEGVYRELRRESTTELFIEVSLSSGKYRCQVIPHNFLNQVGKASEWMYIEVLAAHNPELDDSLPEFILSERGYGAALYEMMVSGKNLIPGAEIFLRTSGGERIDPFEIQTAEDGTHVLLFFEKDQLIAGVYELIVINPGGLRTGRSGIGFSPSELVDKVGDIKPVRFADAQVDIFLSVAWMPSFMISDKENRFFRRNQSLSGAAGRFGVASAKLNYFNPGLELAASYDAEGHLWGVGLNLLALKRLPGDKMVLTFRLGAGYSVHLQADTGVSFLLFVMNQRNKFRLYLETGFDYAHWFTDTEPQPGCFRPWIGVGFSK